MLFLMQTQTVSARYAEVDISGKVRAVAAEFRASHSDLADALSISRQGIARRMKGTVAWGARDLAILADRFDVPIGRFYGDNS